MTTETTAPVEETEKSLHEELQAAYQEAVEADPAESSAAERARDDRGRFSGKTESVDAVVVEPTQQAAATGTGAPTQQAEQPAAVPPPSNLKPELRAAWDAAPPELRKYIADREAEVHKGFTRMDEERQFGKQLKDVIQPYMPLIQAQGGNPASAVQSLLNTAYIFTAGTPAQKIAALQQVAQQYQIPLESVQQMQHQQRVDPHLAALQQQVQQLTNARQQEVTQREEQENYQIQSEIAAFAATPGHDHYEQVKPHMAALLTNGLAKDLQDAYDQAIWARPDLRQTVLAAQQHTAKQAQASQAQARSAAAKQAAGSVSGTAGVSIPVRAPDRSLEDELRANLRAAQH